jgi:hypothetical protein
MGKGFKHGGSIIGNSEDLGFKIITYPFEDELPEVADENTIAILTDSEIVRCSFYRGTPYTKLGFDVDQNKATGSFLIATGKYSPVYFDIDKGNCSVRVYPIGVYESYRDVGINNVWVKKDARIYKNGQWMSFDTDIYNYGDQCNAITGGWEIVKSGKGAVSFGEDYLFLGCDDSADSYASIYTKNAINFSEYTQMVILFENLTHVQSSSNGIKVGIVNSPYKGTSFADTGIDLSFQVYEECTADITKAMSVVIDLTKIHEGYEGYDEQTYYVQFAVTKSNATIKQIYLCGDRYVSGI